MFSAKICQQIEERFGRISGPSTFWYDKTAIMGDDIPSGKSMLCEDVIYATMILSAFYG